VLHIQGPIIDTEYWSKVVATAGDLMGTRIKYLEPVKADQVRAACQRADVGLISYEPIGPNNTYCCPNKFSHYLSSGLPIIANKLEFIGKLVAEARCGVSLDFSDTVTLAGVIDEFATDPDKRRQFADNSARYFREVFNWQQQSKDFYAALDAVPGTARHISVPAKIDLHVEPRAQFEKLISRFNLIPVTPCIVNGRLDRQWDAVKSSMTQAPLEFAQRDGVACMDVVFPYVTDPHSIFLRFKGAWRPEKICVEVEGVAGPSGPIPCRVERDDAFVSLPGNPATGLSIAFDMPDGKTLPSLDELIVLTTLQGVDASRLGGRSVHADMDAVVSRHALLELQPLRFGDQPSLAWNAVASRVERICPRSSVVDGGRQTITVTLPMSADLNCFFLALAPVSTAHYSVTSHGPYGVTGEQRLILNRDGQAFVRWTGGLTDRLVVSSDEATPFQLTDCRLFSAAQAFQPAVGSTAGLDPTTPAGRLAAQVETYGLIELTAFQIAGKPSHAWNPITGRVTMAVVDLPRHKDGRQLGLDIVLDRAVDLNCLYLEVDPPTPADMLVEAFGPGGSSGLHRVRTDAKGRAYVPWTGNVTYRLSISADDDAALRLVACRLFSAAQAVASRADGTVASLQG
jgi:hypothetical protein